jgi:predicted RNA binding protein YcfA (HicA-like mRNA interferase family)
MSIDHLDTLHQELPELFQDRALAPEWDEGLIVVRVGDVESMVSPPVASVNTADWVNEDQGPTQAVLEEMAAEAAAGAVESGCKPPHLPPGISEALGGAHSGGPIPYDDPTKMPPPECLAFYLPFHYYHPTWWGVYLLLDGVVWLAGEIIRRSGGEVSPERAVQASRLFLYYHEAFHHKTECFATRLELTHRKPFYKTGFERLYQKTFMTVDCLEEALANASALIDRSAKQGDPAVDKALEGYVLDSPPGYDQGVRIRKGNLLRTLRCEFAEKNQNICLPMLPAKNPDIWHTAPHLFDGIANIKSRVNYVVHRDSPLAARLRFRALLPPGKLIRKLKEVAGLEWVRSGGNHDIYRTRNGQTIPIPRHPGDLGRGLIRKILREAGVKMGLQEFMQQ